MTVAATLPHDHPQRRQLADEVHSRPPAAVRAPAAVACLALFDADPAATLAALRALAGRYGHHPDFGDDAAHVRLELAGLSVKWERHGEFVTFTIVSPLPALAAATPASIERFPSAFGSVPADWLAALPGRTIAATDVLLLPCRRDAPPLAEVARWFRAESLAAADVLDGAAWVFTDFVVQDNGCTRWLALDVALGDWQGGRLAQRLIEIEIYRMTALLAFPLARAAMAELNAVERELERITTATAASIAPAPPPSGAPVAQPRELLEELSAVAARVESSIAATAFRFSAARAYWDIVRARVAELRERRVAGMRTLGGFMGRRMEPAMNSCAAAARRQAELSARLERTSSLLRTRVDVEREEQNQRMLASMERRGKLQLRLQQTVETLSIAAVTYYAVGIVGYAVKPLASVWPWLRPDWVTAAAIPVIGLAAWRVLHRIRRRLSDD